LKPPFPFALPRRNDPAFLPAALGAVLVIALLAQLLLTDEVVLPEAEPAGAAVPLRAGATVAPVLPPPALGQRSIFAQQGGGADAAVADPLGGTVIAGAVRIGRQSYVLVDVPGGGTHSVAVGGTVAGWQLQTITAQGVVLVRGVERINRPFGTAAPAASAGPSATQEEEQ
jgi:hypothetical protein